MDFTKISAKVIAASIVAGLFAVATSPVFLLTIPEPYRTFLTVFLSAAVPSGVAYSMKSPIDRGGQK